MTFLENVASDVTNIFLNTLEHAEGISYTVKGGSAKAIDAVVERDSVDRNFDEDGQGLTRRLTIHISTDATEGIASPDVGDTATIDSLTWSVVALGDYSHGMATIYLERFETVEKTGEGYRIER